MEVALALPDNYYMGIEQISNNTFVMLDGTFLGNMTPSNANPYKHWWGCKPSMSNNIDVVAEVQHHVPHSSRKSGWGWGWG